MIFMAVMFDHPQIDCTALSLYEKNHKVTEPEDAFGILKSNRIVVCLLEDNHLHLNLSTLQKMACNVSINNRIQVLSKMFAHIAV